MSSLQDNNYHDSELIIGLVGPIGTNLDYISNAIIKLLKEFSYSSHIIKISKDIIPLFGKVDLSNLSPSERVNKLMDKGKALRLKRDDLLALATAYKISEVRKNSKHKRRAYVICSLKHPSEVQILRKTYSNGFFLIGVSAKESDRLGYLTTNKLIDTEDAKKLSKRDIKENVKYGQQVSDTFHLSDFFISYGSDYQKVQNDLKRIIDLIFGRPFVTPTFDEYAMFMAFSASLRSADLSRQVGAVITKNENIISTGANDIPKSGGGLYWPEFDKTTKTTKDKDSGRDYMLGYDSNAREKTINVSSG